MKTVGIVSEFNPFHNGHKYLIDSIKNDLKADTIVAAMSGNFTQRGEIASFDMYTRAQIACQNGVDLVLEIPPQFVLRSAQFYAEFGVYLLNSLGSINYLAFGSESGNLEELQHTNQADSQTIKNRMKTGMTYAKAIGDSSLLQSANNILGMEYLNALKKLNSNMVPYTVQRVAVAHDSLSPIETFASASYIRKSIDRGLDVSKFVPELPNSVFVHEDALFPMLQYRLANATPDDLKNIQNISEGLENRILATRTAASWNEMIDQIKCKRYPVTRIRRALYSILLQLEKSDNFPTYTRVLAFTERGQALLKKMKKTSAITIHSRITKNDISNNIQLQKELFCNEIFALAQEIRKRG